MINTQVKVLIIEDSWLESELLKELLRSDLEKAGLCVSITAVENEKDAYVKLANNDYDIGVFDIDLDKRGAGLELLKQFSGKVAFPLISTARQAEEVVSRGYKYGSEHFINKPIDAIKIGHVVTDYIRQSQSRRIKDLIRSKYLTEESETIEQIFKIINIGDIPLHIHGPTGVGKQVIAELAHEINNSKNSIFLEKNCSTIQESLAESVLFGHRKGAFTGAVQDQKGLFERASGGTLFLDEINRTSKALQAKLLKVLEQKTVEPLGSEKSVEVNFHLVTASSQDLEELVREDKFLPDLWERLRGEVVMLKPLRERPVDIDYQLLQFMKKHETGRLFSVSRSAKAVLLNYEWPGNTRELKNLVNRLQKRRIKVLEIDHLKSLNRQTIRGKYQLANQQILKNASKVGLSETLDLIAKEVIEHYYSQNFGSPRKTMRQLDISSGRFYKHIDKAKTRESRSD